MQKLETEMDKEKIENLKLIAKTAKNMYNKYKEAIMPDQPIKFER